MGHGVGFGGDNVIGQFPDSSAFWITREPRLPFDQMKTQP